jgi:tRNA(Ser,Leu) C12 N-acetylase TAN1
MGKFTFLAVAVLLATACSGEKESIEEYNKKQAERLDSKKPQGKAVKIETAVRGGTKIGCAQLIEVDKLTQLLEEKEPVALIDKTREDPEATSVCSVRRGGKLDPKKMEEQAKKTMKLGVLAGDELCSITAYCSIPADETKFREQCKNDMEKGNMKSSEVIGAFACIKVTQKGPDDAFTYKFIDADTRCVISVRGGPSVNDEAEVQRCAKAALVLIDPASLTGERAAAAAAAAEAAEAAEAQGADGADEKTE